MGSTNLQQLLRSLCLNTDWKYAIFWKLKHRARMYVFLSLSLLVLLFELYSCVESFQCDKMLFPLCFCSF